MIGAERNRQRSGGGVRKGGNFGGRMGMMERLGGVVQLWPLPTKVGGAMYVSAK